MSPDIEWQVGDEGDQSTIFKTRQPRPPRWRSIGLLLMGILGIGLALAYYSIPAPSAPPRPTPLPTLTPTTVPPPLAAAIALEAQALAQGDKTAFLSMQDPDDASWDRSQQLGFEVWGTAPTGSTPYGILQSETLPGNSVWADVLQFRQGSYFRETRFYRLRNGVWVRTRPDLAFWGDRQSFVTDHFHVTFTDPDSELAYLVAARFESAYTRICTDLECSSRDSCADGSNINRLTCSSLPRELTITLQMQPELDQPGWIDQGSSITITLPSPRVMGITESGPTSNDPIDRFAYDSLTEPLTRVASGGMQRWTTNKTGEWFQQSIAAWERLRLRTGVASKYTQSFYTAWLAGKELLPVEMLWRYRLDQQPDSPSIDEAQIQTDSIIAFIDQEFGPQSVAHLLNAMAASPSLAQAINLSLNLPYADFEQQWLNWLHE